MTKSKPVPEVWKLDQIPRQILRDMRRPSHFQKLQPGDQLSSSSSSHHQPAQKVLKDLSAKVMSQVKGSGGGSGAGNSGAHCSYSMFSNDSSESIDTTATAEESSTDSLCSVRRMGQRSTSSQELLNLDEAVPQQKQQQPAMPPAITKISPASVPNFRSLLLRSGSLEGKSSPLEPQTPVSSIYPPHDAFQIIAVASAAAAAVSPAVPRSDSACTFQSYDLSCRSSCATSSNGGTRANMAASASLAANPKLVDLLEEEAATARDMYSSDDFSSSLSGYESIEAEDESGSGGDTLKSFANPHYLGPDVQSVMYKVGRSPNQPPPPPHLMTRDESHQSFAAALNSPADSLFSDYQDFHAKLNKDFVELTESGGVGNGTSRRARPKSVFVESTLQIQRLQQQQQHSTPPTLPATAMAAAAAAVRKTRPVSAEYGSNNRVAPSQTASSTKTSCTDGSSGGGCNDNNELLLLLFLIGGREVGQVTVFKRPISIWRLDLTKTF